jgi:hypothetical protein
MSHCEYATDDDRRHFIQLMKRIPSEITLPEPSIQKGLWMFHQVHTICNPSEENACAGTCGLSIPHFFDQVRHAIEHQHWLRVSNLYEKWTTMMKEDDEYKCKISTK